MKVVKEIFLTEEERNILKKASEILDFISDSIGDNEDDNFSFYKSPKELNSISVSAHASCFEDCRDY